MGKRVMVAVAMAVAFGASISVLSYFAAKYGVSDQGRHPYLALAIWSLLPCVFMVPFAALSRWNARRSRLIAVAVALCCSLLVWLPRLVEVTRDRAYDYGECLTCICKYAFSYELFATGVIMAIAVLWSRRRVCLCVLGVLMFLVCAHAYLLCELPWEQPDPRLEIPLSFETVKENDSSARTNRPWMSAVDAVDAYVKYHETKGLWTRDIPYLGGVVFLDVNFDGVLELMTVECQGSACCCYSTLFGINPQTRIVEELGYTGSACHEDWCGACWDSGTKLVQDKLTNERRYVSECSVRSDSLAVSIQRGVRLFDFIDGEFRGMLLASVTAGRKDDLKEYEFTNVICGREYPRSEFEDKLEEFSERYYSLDLKLGIIPECELQDLAVEMLRSKFMTAYKAFDYRGNCFAR